MIGHEEEDQDPMGLNDACERCNHGRKWHRSGGECEVVVEHGPRWCSCWRFIEPGTAKAQRIAKLEAELQALKEGAK